MHTYRLIGERFRSRVNSADQTRISTRTSQIGESNQKAEAQN